MLKDAIDRVIETREAYYRLDGKTLAERNYQSIKPFEDAYRESCEVLAELIASNRDVMLLAWELARQADALHYDNEIPLPKTDS